MSFTRTQGTGAGNSSASTSQTATLSGVTAGHLLVVIATGQLSAAAGPTLSVSDSQSNTWTLANSLGAEYNSSDSVTVSAWYSVCTTGGSVTVTVTAGSSALITLSFDEYSNSAGGFYLASTSTGFTTALASPVTTGSLSFVGTGLVLLGTDYDHNGQVYSAGSGFTLGYTQNGGPPRPFASEYDLSAASPITPTLTGTLGPDKGNWTAVSMAFQTLPISSYPGGRSTFQPTASPRRLNAGRTWFAVNPGAPPLGGPLGWTIVRAAKRTIWRPGFTGAPQPLTAVYRPIIRSITTAATVARLSGRVISPRGLAPLSGGILPRVLRPLSSPRNPYRGRAATPKALPPPTPPVQPHPWKPIFGGQVRRNGRVTFGLRYSPALPPIQPHPWKITVGDQTRRRGKASVGTFPPAAPPLQPHPWRPTLGGQVRRNGHVSFGLRYSPAGPPVQPHPWKPTIGGQVIRPGRIWAPRIGPAPTGTFFLLPPLKIARLIAPVIRPGRLWVPQAGYAVPPVQYTPLRGMFAVSPGRPPWRRDGWVWLPRAVPTPPPIGRFHGPMMVRRTGEDRARRQRGWLLHWLPIPLEEALPQTAYNVYSNNGAGPINYSQPVATVFGLTYTTAPMTFPATWKWGVRAFNAYGEEKNLDCAVTIILDGSGNDISNRPLPPIGLRAFAQAGGNVRVEWYYPVSTGPSAPTGFHVYWNAGLPMPYSSPVAVSYTSGIANTFATTIGPLSDGVTYYFGVRAYNATAEEPNTQLVSATADATGPAAVDDLVGVATAEA